MIMWVTLLYICYLICVFVWGLAQIIYSSVDYVLLSNRCVAAPACCAECWLMCWFAGACCAGLLPAGVLGVVLLLLGAMLLLLAAACCLLPCHGMVLMPAACCAVLLAAVCQCLLSFVFWFCYLLQCYIIHSSVLWWFGTSDVDLLTYVMLNL